MWRCAINSCANRGYPFLFSPPLCSPLPPPPPTMPPSQQTVQWLQNLLQAALKSMDLCSPARLRRRNRIRKCRNLKESVCKSTGQRAPGGHKLRLGDTRQRVITWNEIFSHLLLDPRSRSSISIPLITDPLPKALGCGKQTKMGNV